MKKKMYEKPSMQVVKLKQQQPLLTGSVGATRTGYGDAEELDWE